MSSVLPPKGGPDPAALYELAFAAGPAPLAFVRRTRGEFRIERPNPAFAECFQLPSPDSGGFPLSWAFKGAGGDQLRRALHQCLADHAPVQLRIAHDASGEVELLQVEARPAPAGGGDLVLLCVQAPRAPLSLASLGEAGVLAEIGALSRGFVYIHDVQRGVIRCAAHPLQKRLGLICGSMRAADALKAIAPADRDLVRQISRRQMEAGDADVVQYVCRLQTTEGELVWVHVRSQVLSRTPDGAVQRILAVAVDETDRVRQRARRIAAEHALAEAEINERRRIGRELHDSTAQLLLAARLGLNALAARETMSQASLCILDEVRATMESAQQEIRNIAFVLHPPALLAEGLEEALRAFIDGFARRTGLAISFEVGRRRWRLAFLAKLALFRVAQEALMNVYRHARATAVVVRVRREGRQVILEVQDDGVGLPPGDEGADGVGVSGMRARIAQAGGLFELANSRQGVLVRASVPTEPPARRIIARSAPAALASLSGPDPILERGSA